MIRFSNHFFKLVFLVVGLSLIYSCEKEETEEQEPQPETIGAWTDFNKGAVLNGWINLYGFSDGNAGYAVFENGNLFEIDTDDFNATNISYPVSGPTHTTYTVVCTDSEQYVFNSINDTLYKYESGIWSVECTLPFYYGYFGGYYQGMILSDFIYLLSSTQSFKYNLGTGEWQTLTSIPVDNRDSDEPYVVYSGGSFAGTELKGKAYVMKSGGDIFKYDLATDNWQYITKYPGIILDQIVSFSYEDKLYFGLSYIDHSPSYNEKWIENELWSYNLPSEEWNEEENIPFDLPYGRFFSFYANQKLYFGHEVLNNYYEMYTYNPAGSN